MTIFNALLEVAAIGLLLTIVLKLDGWFETALERITAAASKAFAPIPDVETGSPYRDAAKPSVSSKNGYAVESLAPACPICGSCETAFVTCHGTTDGENNEGWCTMRGLGHAHVKCQHCKAKHIYRATVKK